MKKKLVVIAGPTAVGKTKYAIDYAKEHNANTIVKGLRAVSDFEYEFQMALINKKIYKDIDTVFLPANEHNTYLSSSMVRQLASMGEDISDFVAAKIPRFEL